jgi:hypothetical protein
MYVKVSCIFDVFRCDLFRLAGRNPIIYLRVATREGKSEGTIQLDTFMTSHPSNTFPA